LREGPGRLGLLALAAIEVERQPCHYSYDMLIGDHRLDSLDILGKFAPFDRFRRCRKGPVGIAQRHTHGLCADIETQQSATIGQRMTEGLHIVADQGARNTVILRRTSARILVQNRL